MLLKFGFAIFATGVILGIAAKIYPIVRKLWTLRLNEDSENDAEFNERIDARIDRKLSGFVDLIDSRIDRKLNNDKIKEKKS